MGVAVDPEDPQDLHVPAAVDDVPVPRYGEASLAEVVPALTELVRGGRPPLLDGLDATRVVLLVVDGLGACQLARTTHVPGLAGLPGRDIDAVFPSTTSASIGAIGTGLPPSQHGIVGYSFPLPGHEHPLNALGWRIGLRAGGFDARSVLVPESVTPTPTALEAAAASGVDTTVVVDPEFPDSGLTRAVLRGGQRRTARGLDTTLATGLDAVAAADGPALAYTHHPLVDWAGHVEGPLSDAWCDTVADVDHTLQRLRGELPPDTAIVVTADHGMVHVPEHEVVELAEHPELTEGVRTIAGEPRVRQLAIADDADVEEVAARWRRTLGDVAVVATRGQALHLFGPDPTPTARRHVGDLVVIARRGSIVHERVDPHGGRHLGQHGGPTAAERLVPLRWVTRG